MRYITHQFAHLETLERARRWLIQAGFNPSRIEAHTQGIPRLAVAVEPGESAEVELVSMRRNRPTRRGTPASGSSRQKHIYCKPGKRVVRCPRQASLIPSSSVGGRSTPNGKSRKHPPRCIYARATSNRGLTDH